MAYFGTMMWGEWSKRVWTWQEAELPPKLLFCSEQAGSYRYDPYDHEFLKGLFPYKILEKVGDDEDYNDDMDELHKLCSEAVGMVVCFEYILQLGKKDRNIWDNVIIAANSQRRCTNDKDFVYGIMGILNLDIPKSLDLDDAMVKLEYGLQKQGIFVGSGRSRPGPSRSTLSSVYHTRKLIDGVTVLGRVDGLDYEKHGKISSKSKYKHSDRLRYSYIDYKYKTDNGTIFFSADEYNINDILETTKVGRKECTFKRNDYDTDKNEIFEIVESKVRIVGYMDKSEE